MTGFKRGIGFVLAMAMLVTCVAVPAFASDNNEEYIELAAASGSFAYNFEEGALEDITGIDFAPQDNVIDFGVREGERYLALEGVSNGNDFFIDIEVSNTSHYMVIQADFKIDRLRTGIQLASIRDSAGNRANLLALDTSGNLVDASGNKIANLFTGRWITLSACVDFDEHVYDVYIDGRLAASDISFNDSCSYMALYRVFVSPGSTLVNIDNLKLFEGRTPAEYQTASNIYFDYDFEKNSIAELEGITFNDKDNKIEIRKPEGAQQLRLEGLSNGKDYFIDIPVTNTKRYMTIEADFMVEKLRTGIQFASIRDANSNRANFVAADNKGNILDANDNKIGKITSGKWFNLAVCADFDKHTYDVYIDNVRVANDVSFNSSMGYMTLYRAFVVRGATVLNIDNLTLYEGQVPADYVEFSPRPSTSGIDVNISTVPAYDQIKIENSKIKTELSAVKDAVCLKVDAPLALVRHERQAIDSSNGDIAPVQANEDVMVPADFLVRTLGFSASYANDTVTMTNGSVTLQMPIGSYIATKNGAEVILTNPADYYNGVVMVPVKYVAESLGKKVFWDDMGLIIISDTAISLTREANLDTLRKIMEVFVYERPSRATIKADVAATVPDHPRLLATKSDFDRIRHNAMVDDAANAWAKEIIKQADKYVTSAPTEEEHIHITDDGGRLKNSWDIQDKATTMGMAYQITGNKKYVDAIWYTLEDLCDRDMWPHWHPGHFLDAAGVMWGVSIAYDWMYDAWTPSQRKILEEALYDCGIEDSITGYHGATDFLSPPMSEWHRNAWFNTDSNWNLVCNSGVLAVGIAMATHEKYGDLAIKCMDYAINAVEPGLRCYAPDGGYEEGVSYWTYGTTHAIMLMEALNVATGSSYGLSNAPGFSETYTMPIYMESKWGSFNFSDGAVVRTETESVFWFGKEYDNSYANGVRYNELITKDKSPSYKDLLWYDPDNTDKQASLQLDYKFDKLGTITMRSSWTDEEHVFAGLHGGSNTAYHCHLDSGSFIYDALDRRWFLDIGTDNYNLPYYFNSVTGGKKWQYYSQRAEGHNCFVINPGLSEDQVVESVSPVTKFVSGVDGAYGILDLTKAYANDVSIARRGLMMTGDRGTVIIQDEIAMKNKTPSKFYWFAHTRADVEVEADGRTAILSFGEKKIRVSIVSNNSDFKFSVMDAVSLPTSPVVQTTDQKEVSREGIKKLVISADAITNIKLAVVISPMYNEYTYTYTNLDDWTVTQSADAKAQATDIKIDGKSVKGFAPDKTTYEFALDRGVENVSAIEAVVDESCEYTVQLPREVPGRAFVKVTSKKDSSVYTIYTINVRPAKDIEIEGSGSDGNLPENCLDSDLETRWAVEGEAWGIFTFAEPKVVSSVWLATWKSSTRKLIFDIEVSEDGETFTQVWSGQSTSDVDELEEFKIPMGKYKAIKLVLHGNTQNLWNSILEVDFTGKTPDDTAIINIDNTMGTSVLVNSKNKGTYATAYAKVGSKLNLSSRGNGKFMYWIDSDSNKILGYNKNLSLTVGTSRNIKAVYAESSSAIIVKFTSMKDSIVSGGASGEISVPSDPYLYGYTFKGWYISYSKIDFEDGVVNVDAATEYKAGFVKEDTKYIVNVDGATKECFYNEKVEVVADASKNGQNFSYWRRDGAVVSYNTSYSFYVDGDTTLESVYGGALEAKSVLVMHAPAQTDDRRIAFFAECDISTEYTVIETGMLMGSKPGLNRADEPLKLISKNVKNKGQFTGRRANVVSGNTYYAVAYAVVKDSAGNITTLYSNEVSCTAR